MSQSVRDAQNRDQDLDRLDLDEIKRFLKRRWGMILGTAVICMLLAVIACLAMAPVYTATSQVLLDPPKQRVFGQDAQGSDVALDSSVVDSQIPIILSTRTLSHVVQREHLDNDAEFGLSARTGLLGRLFGLFGVSRAVDVEPPSLDGIDPKLAPVIARLFDHVDVARVAKSNVLSITVSSRDSGKAMRLANAVAEAYVADQIAVHARSIQQAATFFEDRLGNLRDQVRTSERAVADFRKRYGLATTTDEKVTVSEQQLTDLNERLAVASSETAGALAKYQQAMRFKSGAGDLDTLPEIVRSPVINQLRSQQADVIRREADLAVTYGSAYPAVAQIKAQRRGLESAVDAEMKRLVATLKNDYDVAKSREDSLRKIMAGIGNPPGGGNDVGVKLRELERTNLANKALFENFLNKAKLTQEQSSFEAPDARVISPALEPLSPSAPRTKLIVPVAAIAGLILGLGLAAVLDLQGSRPTPVPGRMERATRPEPVVRRSDATILACVPTFDLEDRQGGASNAVAFMDRHPEAAFSRGIVAVADQLLSSRAAAAQVFMLAPLSEGEGCSTLVRCLAVAIGALGKRVLLIDADVERRTLSAGLSLSAHLGLGDVLSGHVSIADAVVPQSAFAFLPVGQVSFDVASPPAAGVLRALLSEARERFDVVLIDGPALYGTDTVAVWAGLIDGLSMVACWDQLLKERFVGTVDAVTDAPNFVGVILNRTMPPVARENGLAIAS